MIRAKNIESAVLGLALQHEDCLAIILSELDTEDFTGEFKTVFDKIQSLFARDNPVNRATLLENLSNSDLNTNTPQTLIDHLISKSKGVRPKGVQTACEYLKPYTKGRKLKELCSQYHSDIDSNIHNIDEFLSNAGSEFFRLLSDNDEERIHHSSDYLMKGLQEVQEPIDKSGRVYTGIDVDKIIKGFRSGQLIVIGGKTSHGKSVFVQNLMYRAALAGTHSGLITMEMTNQEITERIFAMASKVKLDDISERNLAQSQIQIIKDQAQQLKESAGYTIVDESMSIKKLYATARRLKMQHGMGMMIVDYLQQVHAEGNTREQEVAAVVRGLKDIANDLEIPVVALSQFNRSTDGRPQLNQLRESGAIEQWANVAILLWNPSVDGYENFPDIQSEGNWAGQSTQNVIELHVAKNRGGKTGTCKVGFEGSQQRFYNLAPKNKPQSPF